MGPSNRRNSETEGAGRLRTAKRVSMDFIVLVLPVLCAFFMRREFAIVFVFHVKNEKSKILSDSPSMSDACFAGSIRY